MSSKLPVVDEAAVVRVLKRAGFELEHINGSHHIMRNPDGRKSSVPIHAGKTLRRGLLASILKDDRLSVEEFRQFL
ncbi:MAG TPA: type II toxin-antitoxin system HicA family toxin [Candidatus Baltobacteraceae bacterium]|nr:type II toxin-antitoxin system HicA family toxin [Candidatus Baltobacteraceae bacterium]